MTNEEELYEETRSEQWERSLSLSRAQVLKLGAALPLLAGASRLIGADTARAATGPIVKPLPAEWFVPFGTNAEMRWDAVDFGPLTPNERFFVRNHTATPIVDASTWRLTVFGDGLRGAPVSLGYDELLRLPARTVTTAIECAGNGRSFFSSQQGTPAAGTQWRLGAVGVARWRGVPLSDVLDRAGIRDDAVDVLPQGLDTSFVSGGVDYGRVRRPLPVSKALDDVLLAYEMNGEPLPPDHGYPVRLVVPGWIGIASIKWLGQLEVARRPLFTPWSTRWYRLTGGAYPVDSPPITNQVVKSALELARGAELVAGRSRVTGRAWSGTSPIRGVDVSLDRGASWAPALLHARGWDGWTPWSFRLPDVEPGARELWARATDEDGRTQPLSEPYNENGYLFGGVIHHPVAVRSA